MSQLLLFGVTNSQPAANTIEDVMRHHLDVSWCFVSCAIAISSVIMELDGERL